MAFDSLGDFFAMGDHGFYVWFAYGLTFLVLAALVWHSIHSHGATLKEIAAQRKRTSRSNSRTSNSRRSNSRNSTTQ